MDTESAARQPPQTAAHPGAGGAARRVLRGTLALTGARVAERAAGFVVALLVAAHTGAAGLGAFSVALALYSLMAIAGEAGTSSFLIREISRAPSRTSSLLAHVSALAVGACGVLLAALAVALPHLDWSRATRTSVELMCLAVVPRVLNSIQEAAFVAHGRAELQAWPALLIAGLQVVSAAGMLQTGRGVSGVVVAMAALQWVLTIIYAVLVNRCLARVRPSFRWSEMRRLLIDMKSFTAASVMAALFARPEIVLLSFLATDAQTGYYGAAVRLTELPLLLTQALLTSVFPELSSAGTRDADRFRQLQAAALRICVLYAAGASALLVAGAGPLVDVLFGRELAPAGPLVQVLAASVVLFSMVSLLWRSLAALGRQSLVVLVQVAVIVVRLPLAVLLIHASGSSGAAVAMTAATGLHAGLLSVAVARAGAPLHAARQCWRAIAAGTVVAAAGAIAASSVRITILIPCVVVGYALLVVLLRGVDERERRAVLRLMGRRARPGRHRC